jgi:hypothetical protein
MASWLARAELLHIIAMRRHMGHRFSTDMVLKPTLSHNNNFYIDNQVCNRLDLAIIGFAERIGLRLVEPRLRLRQ